MGLFMLVVETAMALQEAGCFALVLEYVPAPVSAAATSALKFRQLALELVLFAVDRLILDYYSFLLFKIYVPTLS